MSILLHNSPVVVQQWYYKFDPNAETLYASVHTSTTTTDTRSDNANASTQSNICEYVSLVSHYLNDIPCKNYNYTFVFVKVIPKTVLVPLFFPDTVY